MNFKTVFNASISADWLPLTSRRFEQHVGGVSMPDITSYEG